MIGIRIAGRSETGDRSAGTPPRLPERRRAGALGGESGLSLVEELVALAIVAVGVGFVLSTVGTATVGVTTTDEHVVAEALARSQIESIKNEVYRPQPAPYLILTAPANYSLAITVDYWTAPNGPFNTTGPDNGLQRITVTVSHGGRTVLTLQDFKVSR